VERVKWPVALCGGVVTAYLGGWDLMLTLLVGFVIIDYVVAVIVAAMDGRLSSKVGFRGIAKKMLIFVVVGIACMLDAALGQDMLRNVTIWFYIANEGISILENLGIAGVPFPRRLSDALEIIRERGEKE